MSVRPLHTHHMNEPLTCGGLPPREGPARVGIDHDVKLDRKAPVVRPAPMKSEHPEVGMQIVPGKDWAEHATISDDGLRGFVLLRNDSESPLCASEGAQPNRRRADTGCSWSRCTRDSPSHIWRKTCERFQFS